MNKPLNYKLIPVDEAAILYIDMPRSVVLLDALNQYVWTAWHGGESIEAIVDDIATAFNESDTAKIAQDIATSIALFENLLSDGGSGEEAKHSDVQGFTVSAGFPVSDRNRCLFLCFQDLVIRIDYQNDSVESHLRQVYDYYLRDEAQASEISASFHIVNADDQWFVVLNNEVCYRESSYDNAILRLITRINDYLANREPWNIRFHAAAVEYNQQALLIAAPSGSGKSTLAAELLDRGCLFLNDDVAMIKEDFTVASAPFFMNAKSGSYRLLLERYPDLPHYKEYVVRERPLKFLPVPPENHSLGNVPIKAVVIPYYEAGVEARQIPASLDETVQVLFGDSVLISEDCSALFIEQLVAHLRAVPCYYIHYGSSEDAMRLLEPLLSS